MAATGVTATLTSSTPKVMITQPGTSAYADMAVGAVGGVNLSPFTFTLASDYPCGQTADFTLTVNSSGGTRVLNFTVPTGLLSITNTLGTKPPELMGVTTATGSQVNRINRNGVISACGTAKAFPGAITGSHTFDSYTFTACRAFCMTTGLNAGAAGVNLFESAYSPSYNSSSIGTNYAGDSGLSTNIQSFGISTTADTPYTIVVSDVAGNPLPPPAPPNTYTIQIPSCALNCTVNQLPVANAQNVTVVAANTGGTANANVDNGSFDPGGAPVTMSQIPPGPYAVGNSNVILTVVDTEGATAQANATVTVNSPGFNIALSLPSIVIRRGDSATQQITFTPNPGIGAPITFSCSTLPLGSTCEFSPSSLPAGSPATNLTLTVSASSFAANTRFRLLYATWMPFAGMGLIGMIVSATPNKRRKTSVLLTLFVLGALVLFAGCAGGNGTLGPLPVTVSATSGNVTQTATFNLTVQH